MRILIVNKFLYPRGGAETYTLKIGDYLKSRGHQVEYFGMDDEKRTVGNSAEMYTTNMDFHSTKLEILTYPFKIVHSREANKKMKAVLEKFKPEVVHLNNFNFQLTPSIILAIKNYEKASGSKVKIVYTAHDYQLICPNHLMNNPISHSNCERCVGGNFINCTKGKCIHGSRVKSIIGTIEGYYWNGRETYKYIDTIICPSKFMANKMNTNPLFKNKTVVLRNFIEKVQWELVEKKDYVLYFGRYSREKGIDTLIEVCKALPEITFVFAGTGPMEEKINNIVNIKNVGFKNGKDLERLIKEAKFSIAPSECYDNCPFSVMESQMYGTPVLGADIGGIPELIEVGKTGELFKSGDKKDLKEKIKFLWENEALIKKYSSNCKEIKFDTIDKYYEKLIKIYES